MSIDFPLNPTQDQEFTDGNSVIWVATHVAPNPVRWQRQGAVTQRIEEAPADGKDYVRNNNAWVEVTIPEVDVLVGGLTPWPGASAPSGYLLCNGSAVSRITYSALFAVLGSTYGNGDGSTTFNIPDYRGEFLRGVDAGIGNDPDAGTRTHRGDGSTGDVVGSKQAEETLSHTHAPSVEVVPAWV